MNNESLKFSSMSDYEINILTVLELELDKIGMKVLSKYKDDGILENEILYLKIENITFKVKIVEYYHGNTMINVSTSSPLFPYELEFEEVSTKIVINRIIFLSNSNKLIAIGYINSFIFGRMINLPVYEDEKHFYSTDQYVYSSIRYLDDNRYEIRKRYIGKNDGKIIDIYNCQHELIRTEKYIKLKDVFMLRCHCEDGPAIIDYVNNKNKYYFEGVEINEEFSNEFLKFLLTPNTRHDILMDYLIENIKASRDWLLKTKLCCTVIDNKDILEMIESIETMDMLMEE